MLYRMAMFDDVAEGTAQDGIRSLRSDIKAFFHHGVCPDGEGKDGWADDDASALRDLADAQGYATTTLLSREATREAVIEELRRAARDLNAGDQFLFTNASHGSQLADFNGDEKEIANRNPDSTICLYDDQMIDDELWHLFGDFKSGVRIVMISDSCHSGTIARLHDELGLSIGAVQFRSLDARKGVLFAHWGKSVDSVGVAAVRLVFNRDFYETVARPVVEQRLTDAPSQILAFKLEHQPT